MIIKGRVAVSADKSCYKAANIVRGKPADSLHEPVGKHYSAQNHAKKNWEFVKEKHRQRNDGRDKNTCAARADRKLESAEKEAPLRKLMAAKPAPVIHKFKPLILGHF